MRVDESNAVVGGQQPTALPPAPPSLAGIAREAKRCSGSLAAVMVRGQAWISLALVALVPLAAAQSKVRPPLASRVPHSTPQLPWPSARARVRMSRHMKYWPHYIISCRRCASRRRTRSRTGHAMTSPAMAAVSSLATSCMPAQSLDLVSDPQTLLRPCGCECLIDRPRSDCIWQSCCRCCCCCPTGQATCCNAADSPQRGLSKH
jgi:hypothetical protein